MKHSLRYNWKPLDIICLIMVSAIGPASHRDTCRISALVGKLFFPLIFKLNFIFLPQSVRRRLFHQNLYRSYVLNNFSRLPTI